MTGMTAYFGLLDIGKPQPGNTLVVSGAAGAVGILVGQIGKLKGCRVIGITSGVEKCQYITNHMGFDVAIDYKTTDFREQLNKHCSNGIDIYFDNVGGDILDAALSLLNYKARVVLCGAISQYNNQNEIIGPKHYLSLLINRAKMEGFIVSDYKDQYPQATKAMSQWLSTGQIKSKESIVQGDLDLFPPTFLKLFHGENLGKLILALE
jgi:NADPH-dependent curcumin reductase CurA